MPMINYLYNQLSGQAVFSILDTKSGNWQS